STYTHITCISMTSYEEPKSSGRPLPAQCVSRNRYGELPQVSTRQLSSSMLPGAEVRETYIPSSTTTEPLMSPYTHPRRSNQEGNFFISIRFTSFQKRDGHGGQTHPSIRTSVMPPLQLQKRMLYRRRDCPNVLASRGRLENRSKS